MWYIISTVSDRSYGVCGKCLVEARSVGRKYVVNVW